MAIKAGLMAETYSALPSDVLGASRENHTTMELFRFNADIHSATMQYKQDHRDDNTPPGPDSPGTATPAQQKDLIQSSNARSNRRDKREKGGTVSLEDQLSRLESEPEGE